VGLPPAPRGVPQIEVTFTIDANGIVNVAAKDLGTGKEQSVQITAQGGLTEEEITSIISSADQHRVADARRRKLAELRNSAEGLIYATERSLQEGVVALGADEVAAIRQNIELLNATLDGDDTAELEKAFRTLETSAHRIAEALYGNAPS
jgi:molecular chaperone DnaK